VPNMRCSHSMELVSRTPPTDRYLKRVPRPRWARVNALRIAVSTGLWCSLVFLVLAFGATQASAQSGLLVVDDVTPALKQGDDGVWSGTLGVTNLTDGAMELSLAPADATDTDCQPELSKKAIGEAQGASPKLTVPNTCESTDGTFEFTLTASNSTSQAIAVEAELQEDNEDPNWGPLRAFVLTVPLSVVALYLLVHAGWKTSPPTRLEYLGSSWSFKDSWLSNITILGAVLTGIFGSANVVKAFLGDEPDRHIAVATVGSVIAVIFIGAGPIILNTLTRESEKQQAARVFTAGGLLVATGVAAGGALGQLWVGFRAGLDLEPDGWEWKVGAGDISWDVVVGVGAVVAVVLLVAYTLVTLRATIKTGLTEPPPPPPPPAFQDAIARWALSNANTRLAETVKQKPDDLRAGIEDARQTLTAVQSEMAAQRYEIPRRRAAMP
jgi:hypothetical protein